MKAHPKDAGVCKKLENIPDVCSGVFRKKTAALDPETDHADIIYLLPVATPGFKGLPQKSALLIQGFRLYGQQQLLELLRFEFLSVFSAVLIHKPVGEQIDGISLLEPDMLVIKLLQLKNAQTPLCHYTPFAGFWYVPALTFFIEA